MYQDLTYKSNLGEHEEKVPVWSKPVLTQLWTSQKESGYQGRFVFTYGTLEHFFFLPRPIWND